MKLKQVQKTHVPAAAELEKKWLLVNVEGKTLGKTAAKIANLLRGKEKPFFTPQLDCGDYVVVINAEKIRLAGNKLATKKYYWHTGYPAGLRTRTAKEILKKKPEKILYDAVWGMLPRNKLRRAMMKHLRVYAGEEHANSAQTPKLIEI